MTNNAPTFAPPANISTPATGASGAVVSFTATGGDVEDSSIPAVCAPVSGSTFPITTTTVNCTVTDSLGATATGSFTVTVTNNAPTFAPPANISTPATGATGAVVSFTATGGDVEDSSIPAVCTPQSGSTFPITTTTVNCTVTDSLGATATGSFTVTVTNNAPTFAPPANISTPATGASGAVVSFTATGGDVEDSSIPAVCTPQSGSTFPITTTTVNCTVTDSRGATATGTFTVTVTNNAPTFTPPVNITAEATGPTGAAVAFTATGGDVEDSSIPAVCTPQSGSTFPIAATTVNCSVTDSLGATATGSFTVTVTDTIAPGLTVTDISANAPSNANAALVTFTPTVTDAVDAAPTVVCTPASGSSFTVGSTTVSCTATDDFANAATNTFTVTVRDVTPPAITVPGNIVAEATSGAGAAASFTATATDVVGGSRPVSCSPASGTVFPLATTTVTCSAVDAVGNSGSASFTVTVRDTTPPTLTVPANITKAATGASGAVVTFATSATDLVSAATVTCDKASGATFALGTTTVTCTAKDGTGNVSAPKSFTVTVTQPQYGFLNVKNLPPASGTSFSRGKEVDFEWKFTIDNIVVDSRDSQPTVTILSPSGAVVGVFTPTSPGGCKFEYKLSSNTHDFHWVPSKSLAAGTYRVFVTSGKTGQRFPATGEYSVVVK